MSRDELLTIKEMYAADKAAADAGVSPETLMEHAGAGAASCITTRYRAQPCAVLCGPGNNGGDGFVIARHLKQAGWPVTVFCFGDPDGYEGEARLNRERWDGEILPCGAPGDLDAPPLAGAGLIVDALFGAGLSRPLEGVLPGLIERTAGKTVVSVDIPSGVHGDTGEVMGAAFQADMTVTFCRAKPGHYLLPGRALRGTLRVIDIGIPEAEVAALGARQWVNGPPLWRTALTWPGPMAHKYSRGCALVVGGAVLTGASRLSARAAQRAGAGAVKIAAPVDAQTIYKVAVESIMVSPFRDTAALAEDYDDRKVSAILAGPGMGLVGATRERVLAAARTGKPLVLDADAISIFEGDGGLLFPALSGDTVLTPHEGEFARLFPDLTGGRLFRVRAAAARSGAVVLLKGNDTVIAAPDGRLAINANASPYLATAGAGDVLAGLIVGLMAQGVPAFEAAAAGAWMHGEAGSAFGPGLIAEDVIDGIPAVLRRLAEDAG